ncbi:hypothetical protein [Chryseobacterium jejuense]|uniref:Uncharacterized protein n=1 Tax=Chryseobacterium jejuense TaxID=445960 RepID=A0A2X2X213_CHRJE|nr:hypothetical protein [Chryseobacterium jejuense]SDI28910.1 hypothetical protein SAMN05421542_0727 [Chryseobacterium jejuense]SQB44621.1 Uncharacterised protein [Chryseobacterium jejuense]
MNISKYQFILLCMLASMAVPAQKKKSSEKLPPRPEKVKYAPPPVAKTIEELMSSELDGNPAFGWKNEPETLTTFTPDDLMERIYQFNGTYSARITSLYPLETVQYKKPDKGDDHVVLLGYTAKYDDYDTVEIKGNKILISDKKNPKKEKITLEMTKKGKKVIKVKELKTGRVFTESDYAPPPSI